MRTLVTIVTTGTFAALPPGIALGHPGHAESVAAALAHPFLWRDHLLPIVLVGAVALALAIAALSDSR